MRRIWLLQATFAVSVWALLGQAVSTAQEADTNKRGNRFAGVNLLEGAPKAGEVAPLFKLKSLDGKDEVDLASFSSLATADAKRPVVLIFGSYT